MRTKLTIILVLLFIYLGELYRLFPHLDIELPKVTMNLRWFVTFVCYGVRFLLIIFVNTITRENKGLNKWANVIMGIFVVQDIGWLVWNGMDPRNSYYWISFYTIAAIDTIFFSNFWRGIFFGRKTGLRKT